MNNMEDNVLIVPAKELVFNYEVLIAGGDMDIVEADRINIGMSGSLELFDDWGLVKAYPATVWCEVTRVYAK